MNHLITGASGFLGTALVDRLKERYPKDKIYCLSRKPRAAPGLIPLSCDLRDPEAVDEAVKKAAPDRVYHLAGQAKASGAADFGALFQENYLTTQWLFDALGKLKKPVTVFFASTVHVYGSTPGEVTEASPPRPTSPYGYSKYLGEKAAEAAAQGSSKLRVIVGRLYTCIGPGQGDGFVVSDFCRRLAAINREGEVLHTGALDGVRSFLDVRDAVALVDDLVARPGPLQSFAIFNLASGSYYSVKELLDQLLEVTGKRPKIESHEATAPNSFLGLQVSTKKLEMTLNPTLRPLKESLRAAWNGYVGRS